MFSVLYLDDSKELLELGKLYLEATGDFAVTPTDSADQALSLLASGTFDLILSDFDMPGMDGIRFLTEVRTRYRDIPFILFTGRAREEIVVEAINKGADFYLQKGGDPKAQFAELAHKIRQGVRRHQAETALAASRDYLDKIFTSVKAGILVIDRATHTIIDVNPAAALMIGLDKKEILGHVCHHYICPAEHGKCPISDLGQTVDNSERVLLTADGRQVPVIKYVTRVDLFGKDCLLETFIDNTERKRAETELRRAYEELKLGKEEIQAAYAELAANEQVLMNDYAALMRNEQELREANQQIRTIVDSANDAIFLVSDGVFLQCNRKTLEIFGCTDESQILGHTPGDFSPELQPDGTSSERASAWHDRQVAEGISSTFEWVHLRRDGTPFNAEVSLTPIHLRGKPGILSIVRDITERKLAENARILAGRKLYMMNEVTRHEIRNLIAGIIGAAEMANALPAGSGRDTLNREIRKTCLEIQRQISFTEQYQEIGIRPPIWQRVQQWIPPPGKIPIRIRPGLCDLEVYADPLLTSIFQYLTENVVMHAVHATEISAGARQDGANLTIIFEDNGIGIPPERKDAIFTRTEGDQNGMGLFLVREILSITGITICETGTFGQGARFEITVPSGAFRTTTAPPDA